MTFLGVKNDFSAWFAYNSRVQDHNFLFYLALILNNLFMLTDHFRGRSAMLLFKFTTEVFPVIESN